MRSARALSDTATLVAPYVVVVGGGGGGKGGLGVGEDGVEGGGFFMGVLIILVNDGFCVYVL
jgi:hypothetical protein